MTRKQIRKLADQIIQLELIHRNPDSSQEEKVKAESQIIQISGMIGKLGGLQLMEQIDELVQEGVEKQENKNKENN